MRKTLRMNRSTAKSYTHLAVKYLFHAAGVDHCRCVYFIVRSIGCTEPTAPRGRVLFFTGTGQKTYNIPVASSIARPTPGANFAPKVMKDIIRDQRADQSYRGSMPVSSIRRELFPLVRYLSSALTYVTWIGSRKHICHGTKEAKLAFMGVSYR